jgi:hypothetical protein
LPLSLLLLLPGQFVRANQRFQPQTPSSDGNFYARWSAQTNAIQSKQPAWAVPLVTTYTRLFQVVRTDIVRQIAPARTSRGTSTTARA